MSARESTSSLPAEPDWVSRGRTPISSLKGVTKPGLAALEKLGLATVADLWTHLPLRYEDRTALTPIAELQPGQPAQVCAQVQAAEVVMRRTRMLVVVINDGSGSMTLRFFRFRQAQVASFSPGRRVLCFGEARASLVGLEMSHPRYQFLGDQEQAPVSGTLTPVYPRGEGISVERIGDLVAQALAQLPASAQLEWLASDQLKRLGLPDLAQALRWVHQPPPDTDLSALAEGQHPARRRLALEELIAQRISLRLVRKRLDGLRAPVLRPSGQLATTLANQLPFALTAAQQRVLNQLRRDLARSQPMLRLVQGDVGCGKTVVAAMAMLAAIEAGHQAALMAPTELLAEQHRKTLDRWMQPLGIEPVWLAAKVTGKARALALQQITQGAPLVVGTHALMTEAVSFKRLGLVVIDEQHRFGVHQRLGLRNKGVQDAYCPHQLVMTATPIPRTLAMSMYADLDVSVIDELPPGRSPITTVAASQNRRDEVVERVRAACAQGRQAYWVCTVIEQSETIEAQAAEDLHAELSDQLAELRVGIVHGRQKPAERQAQMHAFADGGLDLLVATTVIEVGVDVPNASLMVIDNAERLGLAQLHQLRGRVGRGAQASSCVLLYKPPLGELARKRLAALRDSQDGFYIAEQDLSLRGPGELLGLRQSGEVGFKIADLVRDADLLPTVAELADQLIDHSSERAEAVARRFLGANLRYGLA